MRVAPFTYRRWLAANALIVGLWYLLGVALFVVVAQHLDNDFAVEARANHKWLTAQVHLGLLPAYAVIWFVHATVVWPLVRRLAAWRGWTFGWVRASLLALATNLLVIIIGLGPQTAFSPGSLDLLARAASRVSDVNVYQFKSLHIQAAFCVISALAAALLLFDVLAAAQVWALVRRRPVWVALILAAATPLAWGLTSRTGSPSASRDPGATPKAARHDKPNVIVIASDSLRFDHLSAHGYPRPTSPNIDAFAKESVDFERFYVSTASTLESWGSFLTGQFPVNHGLRFMFISRDDAQGVEKNPETLPRLFSRAGYRTSVVGDWAANCFSLVNFGFEETRVSDVQTLDVFLTEVAFRTHVLVPYYFANALGEEVVPHMRQVTGYLDPAGLATRFLSSFDAAAAEDQPFFGVLFVGATHLPYLSPAPWNTKFTDPGYRGPNQFALDFNIDRYIQVGFASDQPAEVRQHVVDLYDGSVAHFDSVVGRVLEHVKARGLDEDTVIIVTSDHGDDLYEPGTTLGHGTNFFGGDQANRIPMIMRLPGGRLAGTRVTGLARNVDLAPTLLELTRAAPRPERMDGVSLVPYLEGTKDLGLSAFAETCYLFYPKRIPGEDATVLAPMDKTLFIDGSFRNLFVLKPEWRQPILDTKDRMVRTDRWKLVYIKGTKGPIWRLYDMLADPHEERDLSRERPDVVGKLAPALEEWMRTGKDQRWLRPDDPIN